MVRSRTVSIGTEYVGVMVGVIVGVIVLVNVSDGVVMIMDSGAVVLVGVVSNADAVNAVAVFASGAG